MSLKIIADRKIKDITGSNRSQVPVGRGSNKIQFIVVHYLGVPNVDNPNLWGGGYGGHYNVKRDGTVYMAADPKTAVVWHCGGGLQGTEGHTFHRICTNYNSIGIECGVGYTDTKVKSPSGDSDQWYFTTETQESLIWLVSKLMDQYGIGIDHVIRHFDVTGKICPNPYVKNNRLRTSWTWAEFKTRLEEYRKTGGYTVTEVGDASLPFMVRVGIDDLNIRTGPGTDHKRTGLYTGKGAFTIVAVENGRGSKSGWGLLKSYADNRDGWISLDFTTRIS